MAFKSEIENTDGLDGAWRSGLKALPHSDRGRIEVESSRRLCGSAAIDAALRERHPEANRWDYVICLRKSPSETAYFVEVHPASKDLHIREIESKARWLLGWLKGTPLGTRARSLNWVAVGKVSFNQQHPKIKALALQGVVLHPGKLRLK